MEEMYIETIFLPDNLCIGANEAVGLPLENKYEGFDNLVPSKTQCQSFANGKLFKAGTTGTTNSKKKTLKKVQNAESVIKDVPASYVCVLCSEETKDEEAFKMHLLQNHSLGTDLEELVDRSREGKVYTCYFCNYRTQTSENLKGHLRWEYSLHNTCFPESYDNGKHRSYACPECSFTAEKKKDINFHIQFAHLYESSDSSEDFLMSSSSSSEEESADANPPGKKKRNFACSHCEYSSQSRLLRNHHVQTQHSTSDGLSLVNGSADSPEEDCENNVSGTKKAYAKKGRPFPCSQCDFRGTSAYSLKQHLRNHNDPQYRCRFCNYRSFKVYRITRHELTHTGEKPFECQDCGATFTQNTSLLTHEKNVHGIETTTKRRRKKLKCESVPCIVCMKVFPSKVLLSQHVCGDNSDNLPPYTPRKRRKEAKKVKKKDVIIKIGDYVLNLSEKK